MKKLIALALSAVMIFGIAACDKTPTETTEDQKIFEKGEGVMTYQEYAAAEVDSPVVVEAFVQGKQSWWDNKASVYLADTDGAYFAYNMVCSEEDYAKLVDGQKIKITGYKAEWAGEVEIAEGATFEIEEGNWISTPIDLTSRFAASGDDLSDAMNKRFEVKDAEVTSEAIYNWDGSGNEGDDLYFNVKIGDNEYTFTVESYLCGADTEVYQTIDSLTVGQKVDLTGFLYWYEGPNPHITAATVK
ncbi:MAG: hypothetical protein IKE53_00600 [Clostridiales bacterium]|nr:hypothetical protein [Clostridiales bacterium]